MITQTKANRTRPVMTVSYQVWRSLRHRINGRRAGQFPAPAPAWAAAGGRPGREARWQASARAASALAHLEARDGLVDDVDAALAPHQTTVLVAGFGGAQRVLDLHDGLPRLLLASETGETPVELVDLPAALDHARAVAGPRRMHLGIDLK